MEKILLKILKTLEEMKELNKPMPLFESPAKFAKRTGFSERLIGIMAKEGQLPHIQPKEKHIMIEVRGAIDVLKKYAATGLPMQRNSFPTGKSSQNLSTSNQTEKKKSRGRPPDSIRKANQNQQSAI